MNEVKEVNERVAQSIKDTLDRFDKMDLNSTEASIVVKEVAEMYKAYATFDLEDRRLKLDEQIAYDKQRADEATAANDKRTFWTNVGDIFCRTLLGTASTMFNAAIFQNLMQAEKDTTIGSTSMKTFLRGGFKIFRNN